MSFCMVKVDLHNSRFKIKKKVVSAAKVKPQNRNFLKTKTSIYMSSYFISTVHQGMKAVGMNLKKLNINAN